MPLHNAERYLTEAFDSLLAQDYHDFEIIVCDNASTDRTWEICEQYAAKDERMRLYRNERNMGAAYNYNRTVELARGELFKWVAYDDRCAPSHLRLCLEELDRAGTETVLAYPQTILIDGDGDEIELYDDKVDLRARRTHQRVAALAWNLGLCNALFGVIRRDALDRTGLIRPYVSSDIVLLAELAALGQFHEIPQRLFYRRIHDRSSRQGQADLATVARWFDPQRPANARPPKVRIGWRVSRCLLAGDLPAGERVRAAAAFPVIWNARKVHIRGSRWKRALLGQRAADQSPVASTTTTGSRTHPSGETR